MRSECAGHIRLTPNEMSLLAISLFFIPCDHITVYEQLMKYVITATTTEEENINLQRIKIVKILKT